MGVGMTAMKGLTARRSGRSFCAGLEGGQSTTSPVTICQLSLLGQKPEYIPEPCVWILNIALSGKKGCVCFFFCSRVRGGRESGFP